MRTVSSLRCVVLGGGGFVGINLCRHLAGRVASLKAFGRRQAFPDALEGVDWFNGDFAESTAIATAIEGADTVFHLIHTTTPASANVDKIADVRSNVLTTLSLLDACRDQGIKRVVFVSSGGTVYGVPERLPTPEDGPCWPITSYGISKLTIERYLHLYNYLYGLEYKILRVANPYGPYQMATKNQGVIAAFLKCALTNQPIEVWGDGTVRRDYLYVDDLAGALEKAALHEGVENIFNIGSGTSHSLNEIIELIGKATGLVLDVRNKGVRAVDVPVSQLDVSKAQNVLDWSPGTGLGDGVVKTANWLRERL